MRNVLFCLFVCFFVHVNNMNLFSQESASNYYLKAANFIKENNKPQLSTSVDVFEFNKHIEKILDSRKDKNDTSTFCENDTLSSLEHVEEAMKLIRQGTLAKSCDWGTVVVNEWNYVSLPYLDDVAILNNLLELKIFDALDTNQYDQAIDYWRDMMTLARRLTHDQWFVSNMKGMEIEGRCIKLLVKHIDNLNNEQIRKISNCWRSLPQRNPIEIAIMHDCTSFFDWVKDRPLQAALEMGYGFSMRACFLDDITVPITVNTYKYSVSDWIGAIYFCYRVDYSLVEKNIDEFSTIITLPLCDFYERHASFSEKVDSLSNPCSIEVLYSLFPAVLAGKTAQSRINKLNIDFEKKL